MSDRSVASASQGDVLYTRIALGSAIITFLMIVDGAITRVSESGMGCGTSWPDCNGLLVPDFTRIDTVIEFGHRMLAGLVGLFVLALLIRAFQRHRHDSRRFYPAIVAICLYVLQVILGALTVKLSNQWLSVAPHLANSMFLLGTLLVAWVYSRYEGKSPLSPALSPTQAGGKGVRTDSDSGLESGGISLTGALLATLLALCVALLGAAVAGTFATKACVGWPLCTGEIWPADQGGLQILNMTHRLFAGALGVVLVYLLIRSRKASPLVRQAIYMALGAYLIQAAIGALVALVDPSSAGFLVVVESLHVAFAAATWSMMVLVSASVWIQQSTRVPGDLKAHEAAPSAITSN